MFVIEALFAVFSGTVALAGLAIVALAVRAYAATGQTTMLHLTAGFGLVVAASLGTAAVAFLTGFTGTRELLTANYFLTTVGYLFVVYSIVSRS